MQSAVQRSTGTCKPTQLNRLWPELCKQFMLSWYSKSEWNRWAGNLNGIISIVLKSQRTVDLICHQAPYDIHHVFPGSAGWECRQVRNKRFGTEMSSTIHLWIRRGGAVRSSKSWGGALISGEMLGLVRFMRKGCWILRLLELRPVATALEDGDWKSFKG